MIELDESMNSHDAVSLFTNVPINESLVIIKKRLEEDKTLHKCTRLLSDDMMEFMDFVESTTYFSYDGRIYWQTQGAPMGSQVSVVVSNLYIEDHEKSIGSAPKEMKPTIWKKIHGWLIRDVPQDIVSWCIRSSDEESSLDSKYISW